METFRCSFPELEANIDNPHSREPWIVASKIKSYRKAMQYLGHSNQQQIYISCHNMGMGKALCAGEYVDLSEDVMIFSLVKTIFYGITIIALIVVISVVIYNIL